MNEKAEIVKTRFTIGQFPFIATLRQSPAFERRALVQG